MNTITFPLLLLLPLTAGCIENKLHAAPQSDTAVVTRGDTAFDVADSADTAPPATEDPDCRDFTVSWTAPFSGHLELQGEFTSPSGDQVAPWQTWKEDEGNSVTFTWSGLCTSFDWRGQASLTTADGAETWACLNSADGTDFIVEPLTLTLDGVPLAPTTWPHEDDDGCDVYGEARF